MRIQRLAASVTGPRGRWVTVAVWIALGVAGFVGRTQINDVTAAGQSSYLPAHAESTQVVDMMQRDFKGGNDVPVLIVFERNGGLSTADLNAIGKLGEGLERLGLSGATPVFAPFSGGTRQPLGELTRVARGVGPISRDGEAALVTLAIDSEDRGAVVQGVKKIRAYLAAHAHPGLHSYVTGPGGVAADLEQVAEDAGQTLLIATLSLVLLLLLLVYRAPLLALMPLLVVGIAYLIAIGLTYLLIKSGAIVVNTEGTFLLLVLIFGAGTDYSLLLIHRYREELARGDDPLTALRVALAESVRPIAASAATVIAAMLVLLLADLESTHWLGPVLAIGIAVMLCAGLTLLPALLAILGPRAFWPGRESGSAGEAPPLGGCCRPGPPPAADDRRRCLRRPRRPRPRQPDSARHDRLRRRRNALERIEPRQRSPRRTLSARHRLTADRGAGDRRSRRGAARARAARLGQACRAGAALLGLRRGGAGDRAARRSLLR